VHNGNSNTESNQLNLSQNTFPAYNVLKEKVEVLQNKCCDVFFDIYYKKKFNCDDETYISVKYILLIIKK